MDIHEIASQQEFAGIIREKPASLFYFSHDQCNICKILKPKVYELLEVNYAEIGMYYVNIHKTPEISGQQSIFAVPTIVVFMDGNEIVRKIRNIGLAGLDAAIEKPYSIFFS